MATSQRSATTTGRCCSGRRVLTTLKIWQEPRGAAHAVHIQSADAPVRAAQITSNTYYDWMFRHILYPGARAGRRRGKFLATFRSSRRDKGGELQLNGGEQRTLARVVAVLDSRGPAHRLRSRRIISFAMHLMWNSGNASLGADWLTLRQRPANTPDPIQGRLMTHMRHRRQHGVQIPDMPRFVGPVRRPAGMPDPILSM